MPDPAATARHWLGASASRRRPGVRDPLAGLEYHLRRYPGFPRDLLQSRLAAEVRAEEFPDAPAPLAAVRRVWVIVGGPRRDPLTGRPDLRPALEQQYERTGLWQLNGTTVALYRRR